MTTTTSAAAAMRARRRGGAANSNRSMFSLRVGPCFEPADLAASGAAPVTPGRGVFLSLALRRHAHRYRRTVASSAAVGTYARAHVLRPRPLRRHRRSGVAKADAGALPGLAPRQAAGRRPHPRRLAPGAERRGVPRLGPRALHRGRGREAAERRRVRALRGAAAPPL